MSERCSGTTSVSSFPHIPIANSFTHQVPKVQQLHIIHIHPLSPHMRVPHCNFSRDLTRIHFSSSTTESIVVTRDLSMLFHRPRTVDLQPLASTALRSTFVALAKPSICCTCFAGNAASARATCMAQQSPNSYLHVPLLTLQTPPPGFRMRSTVDRIFHAACLHDCSNGRRLELEGLLLYCRWKPDGG